MPIVAIGKVIGYRIHAPASAAFWCVAVDASTIFSETELKALPVDRQDVELHDEMHTERQRRKAIFIEN